MLAVLFISWYPVVSSHDVTQPFTYSYQVQTSTQQTRNLYTLPNPVTLQGFVAVLQQSSNFSQTFRKLGDIALQSGWTVHVQVTQCQYCGTTIGEDFGSNTTVYSVTSSSRGTFIVVDAGQYAINIGNIGPTSGEVASLTVTADIPQNTMQTQLGYNTATVTIYSVASVPLYTVLGIFPSLAILVIIALIVVLTVLLEQGLIQVRLRRR